MDEGWIKLHRSLVDWEYYSLPHTVHVLIHLLIKANYEQKKCNGMVLKRGQFITSVRKISEATGLSRDIVDDRLKKLEKCGTIKRITTNKNSIITICNYEDYQMADEVPAETNPNQNRNKPETNPNNIRKEEGKNNIISLSNIPHACEENLLGVEVAKKALCTEEMVRRVFQQYHEDINAIKQGIIDFLKVNEFNDWKSENDIKDHFIKWWREKHPVKDMQKIAKQNEGQRVVESTEDEVRKQREKHKQDDEFNNMLARIAKEHGCSQLEAFRIYNKQNNNGTQGET